VDCNKPSEDIISVASQMLDKRQRRRPIVQDGKLIGQLTCRQIIKATKDFIGPEDPKEALPGSKN
jgi:predicted transcriptional regulator